MIIDTKNRTKLQRVLEEHLAAAGEGEGKKFLLIMLSLIYDLEEMENRRRPLPPARDPSGFPDANRLLPEENPRQRPQPSAQNPSGLQDADRLLLEENRRLKALLDTMLSRIRFSAREFSETAH
jgi:hypothetical protein